MFTHRPKARANAAGRAAGPAGGGNGGGNKRHLRDTHFDSDRVGVQDFVLLEDFRSEAAFLDNLKKRFQSDLIYTVGLGRMVDRERDSTGPTETDWSTLWMEDSV